MTASTAQSSLPPIETRNLEFAKHLKFYRNGDGNFSGRNVTWNRRQLRTFDSFLGELTRSLKLTNGAVRRIYTPVNGHRVKDFSKLEDGREYVAAGEEGFKKIGYTAIDPHPKRRPPINYNDVEPVYHSKRLVSGRIKRARTQSIIIRCWPNGDEVNEPKRILLTCWMQRDLDVVCNAVTERCRDKVTRPISMIYTREGTQVKDADQLEHMRGYVALTHKEKFLKVKYKDASMKNLLTSPRLERRTLPPLMGSRGSKISTKHSSPDHSYASHPGSENSYSQRYRKNYHPRREEDTLFHGRPVAHKRSSDRPQRTRDPHIDFDQDEGGVFRAKGENRATKGAKEVNDTGDTKVDLPIDQVPAEEVTDEDDNRGSQDEKTAPVPSGMELTKLPSEQYDSIKMEEEEEEEKPRGKQNSNNNSYHANGYQANSYQANSRKTQNPRYKANSKQVDDNSRYRGNRTRKDANNHEDEVREKDPIISKPKTVREKNRTSNPNSNQNNSNGRKPAATSTPKKQDSLENNEKDNNKSQREEEAATKIQAGYRGYRTRQQLKTQQKHDRWEEQVDSFNPLPEPERDSDDDDQRKHEAATKIQAGFRGYQARQHLKEENNHSKEKSSAKSLPDPKQNQYGPESQEPRVESAADRYLEDKKNEAATKIQSTFRGYNARKHYKEMKKSAEEGQEEETIPDSVSVDDLEEQQNAAATKIQANYRGYHSRKQHQQL